MSTDEYSTEMELYGVSPGVIAILMFIVTIMVPYGFVPDGISEFGGWWSGSVIYSFIWVYTASYYQNFGFRVFSPEIIITLPLCILNIVYAVWIVRYYQDKSSKYSAAMIGILSILLPTSLALYISGLFGSFIVIYPIPIQFIVGLLVLWRIEGPEIISPWSGMRLDLSWWRRLRPKRKDDWDPFEGEKKVLEEEEGPAAE